MNAEAKLGLVAGILAVVGVALFGMPKRSNPPPHPTQHDSPLPATPASLSQADWRLTKTVKD